MHPTLRFAKTACALMCSVLLSATAHGAMVELADNELSEVTGQAFINLTTDSHAGVNYTRINFGMDIETQLNMNKLKLGLYGRTGEAANTADINIDNFALGSVNADDTINPFRISNPFLELAYKDNKVVGVRLGFGEAQGHLSGNINTYTGNLAIDIFGKGSYLGPKMNCGWDPICGIAKSLVSGTWANDEFKAQASLVNGAGSADPVRGTMAGLPDGTTLSMPASGAVANFLLGLFKSQDCGLLGVSTCFNLSDYGSIPVGKFDNQTQQFVGTANGVFLSMQTENVQWRDQQDASKFITALAGAFMNLPRNADGTAAINLSFQQALEGIARKDTCLGSATHGC